MRQENYSLAAMSTQEESGLPRRDNVQGEEAPTTRVPDSKIQNALRKYALLSSKSTMSNLSALESAGVSDRTALTASQLQRVIEAHASRNNKLDPEYENTLQEQLHAKRIRVDLMRDTLGLPPRRTRNSRQELKSQITPELEKSLERHAKHTAKKTQYDPDTIEKVQSYEILLLKAKLRAHEACVHGKSYATKDGIAGLPERTLNFSVAARYLERYISSMIKARHQLELEINYARDDVDFEDRLQNELGLITNLALARGKQLTEESEERLTTRWIMNTIAQRKQSAKNETKRLMSWLRYTIQSHLAPHICLKAYKLPDLGRPAKKSKLHPGNKSLHGMSKFVVSDTAPSEDIDLSDPDQVSQRLQETLLLLLNQLMNSSPEEVLCTEVTPENEPITQFLLSCDAVVQPEAAPNLFHLRQFDLDTR